jgi:hypothetical protein
LTDFTDADENGMDTDSLPSLEVDGDLIDDDDVLDGMENLSSLWKVLFQ